VKRNSWVFALALISLCGVGTQHVWAQANNSPAAAPANQTTAPPASTANTDAITATFNRAASPAPAVSPPQTAQPAALPTANANNGQSLQELTQALSTDKPLTEQEKQSKAFDNALNNIFPLSPEQIQAVMRRMSEVQEAGRAPPEPDPQPVVKVDNVSLDPGVSPPLIRVAVGYVTTVNILDITGQPWPIQDVVIGGNFQVTGPNDAHVLRLIPQTRFGKGNLSVRLVGLSTPVTFRVEAGGSEVYYRYDARIPQAGPGARQSLIEHGFAGEAGDPTLMAVLDGTPPTDSTKLVLSGVDGRTRAWKIHDQIYLRTPLTLLSPGWDASVRSADGTNVYTMLDAPVMMLSDNGQLIRAHLAVPPEDPFKPRDLQEGKITVPVNATAPAATPGVPTTGAAATAIPANAAAAAPVTATQPLAGQAALSAATQPPIGGSIANEASQRRSNGVQIYTGGNYPQNSNNAPSNVVTGGQGS